MSQRENLSESKIYKETKENIALADIACAGLIAVGLVILQAFITIKPLDTPEFISVLSFAIAIPFLAGRILQNFLLKLPNKDIPGMGCSNTYAFGAGTALIGIDAAFWHVSYIAGIVFIVSSVIAAASFFLRLFHLPEEEISSQLDDGKER